MNRSLWFRFWVDLVSEGILKAQYAMLRLGCPSQPVTDAWTEAQVRAAGTAALVKAIISLWVVSRLSWCYHRALDLARIGL